MHQIDIVLADGFPMLSLTLITEPLRLANRESLEQSFSWRCLSPGQGPVLSSSGFQVPTTVLDDRPGDVVLLLASYQPEKSVTQALLNWLRARSRRGTIMGCVDTGALIFAKAGLLAKQPAAAHFEAITGFAEAYPREMFVDRLFDFAPPRCSSAGGVATFDMTLAIIRHFTGARLARRVSQILTYMPSEHRGDQERLMPDLSLGMVNRHLATAVEIMSATLQTPVPIAEISEKCGIPQWHLARLCKRHLHKSPSAYYLSLRLARARNLLRNSHHRVGEIAMLCGFENPETFTRAYKREHGCQPSHDRTG